MEDTILSTGVPNLSAITCGPIPPSPSELLHSAGFTALLGRLSQQFDRIIINSPPVAAVSDALIIATQVDGAVLVVKAGKTTRDAVQRAARSLGDVKARILGAVLNDIDMQDSRYGGYYYAYGQYYGDKREGTAS
jgi:capsular exopolysaccharide synthesis family protein